MNIRCPHCGRDNPERARFCMHCSGPLTQSCTNCGATLSLKAQFCSRCGTAIRSAAAPGVPPAGATGRLPPATLLAARYRIIRKLGQGGMGAVYLAEDLRLNGKYWAVKEMSDAALTDPGQRQAAVQAFRQEAEMLARLDHPHLPRVSDYFSESHNQYLVMEYVQGQTLEEKLVQANGPLPETQVTVWAEQLCTVLAYLHSQQPPIIFRDLKPGNIMVRADGEVKLIDFGIARHFKPGQSKDTQAFGTMGYAAPEQHGKGQTDVRSDIYALGATLHHLLTGRDPAITPFMFERVRKVNATVSRALDETIAKAVEIDPLNRWQSAQALRRTLPTSTPGKPKVVTPQTQSTPAPSSTRKSSAWARFRTGCMVTGIGITLVVGLFLFFASISTWLPRLQIAQPTIQPVAQQVATRTRLANTAIATVTAVARVQATATRRAVVTATARAARATAAARPTATAAAQAQAAMLATSFLKIRATPVATPIDGELTHDPASNSIKFYTITDKLRNFVAEVHFYNPYRRTEGAWDYGIGFRDTGGTQQYRIVAESAGIWHFYLLNGDASIEPIASGTIANLDVTPNGSNFLQLWVSHEAAYFYVNQAYVTTLDVSAKTIAGTVWIGTGMMAEHEQSGATTRYEDFTVWSLPD